VAGNVVLDRDEVRSILSLYHLEDLEDFGGIEGMAPQTAYWVKAGGRRYDLRITERKTLDDMVFEKDLLVQLRRAGLPVPSLVRNVARGTFTPWARRGRYVSLFEHIPGRPLGRFEVRARHARAVGRLLGDVHRAAAGLRRRRANPASLAHLLERLGRLERALDKRRLAQRHAPAVRLLGEELERQSDRLLQSVLPMGPIHGDLGLSRVRWLHGHLSGVVDFEPACRDRLVLDLAQALSEWAWEPSSKQQGGPAGRFKLTTARGFLDGYQRSRVLSSAEREALPDELRFVAVRCALIRLSDHELSKRSRRGGRPYQDYRHATARLEALADDRAETLVRRALERR
jgi:homoserine kinase type II